MSEKRRAEAHRLYVELGTLQAVGDVMGITRERVRQLIAQGIRNNEFPKPSRVPPGFDAEAAYRRLLHGDDLVSVAQENGLSLYNLKAAIYKAIGGQLDWKAIAKARSRRRMIEQYERIVSELGYHPTTTYLQRHSAETRALNARITREWGSIEAFRLHVGAPFRKQGNPRLRADVQRGLAHVRAQQRLRRVEIRRRILDRLQIGTCHVAELQSVARCSAALLEKILTALIQERLIVDMRVERKRYLKLRNEQ